ncbi:MAG: hypothetical protein Q9179_002172 [Wetmoreana sp. 5 TL-2023]
MNVMESRYLLLAWLLHSFLCFAIPLQHLSIDVVQSPSGRSHEAAGHVLGLQTLSDTHIQYHTALQHVRRGSGGSAPIPVPLGSFQLQTKTFKAFSSIVPSILAASYITDFLEIIALRIETGVWGHDPPTNHRVIQMWSFELTFHSFHTAIPWDFIQAYVIDMADDIAKGFVGTFDEHMTGVINGVATAVSVSLKIINRDPPLVVT